MVDIDPFQREAWSAEWGEPSWGNFQSNTHFLQQTKAIYKPAQILDIGCHKGLLLKYLASQGHEVYGIDLEEGLLAESKAFGRVCVGRGESLPFREHSFDVVTSFDVFEHILDSDAHLCEVRRVLRPGGYYLLQTPNKWTNMFFEAIVWARKFGIRHAFDFLRPPAHCALHNYWQLRRRLVRHGFEPCYVGVPVVNDYFIQKVQRVLGGAGVLALKIYNPDRSPLWLRTNFYVSARLTPWVSGDAEAVPQPAQH